VNAQARMVQDIDDVYDFILENQIGAKLFGTYYSIAKFFDETLLDYRKAD